MIGTYDDLPSGRVRLRMYVSGKQETIGTYDSREEAEAAAEAHAVTLKETEADFGGLTLAKYGKAVLTARDVRRQVRDPKSDWSRWNTHVKSEPLAAMTLSKVQPPHITRWLSSIARKGLGIQTQRNCLNLLRVIFGQALEEGRVKINPAVGLRVRGKSEEAWTYLGKDELPKLLGALPSVERHLVGFAIGTGLRAGELCSLRLADVHLGDRPRVVVRYGRPPDLPTKTSRVRTVPLFGLSLAALEPWLQLLPTFCKKNKAGLLFPRPRGGFRHWNHVILWGSWQGALEAAGIARRFRWHDLRHTCASWLVSGWWGRRWSLQEVKEMLGHTSITTTQRYAHLAESALEEAGRMTSGRDNSRHAALLTQEEKECATRPEKSKVFASAPPVEVESTTFGLGIRSFPPDGAEKAARVSDVTCEGDAITKAERGGRGDLSADSSTIDPCEVNGGVAARGSIGLPGAALWSPAAAPFVNGLLEASRIGAVLR